MKIAIFESIVTPGGHEHDFDKMLIRECLQAGHDVELIVPEGYPFKLDYGVPVRHLRGEAVSYAGVSGLKKTILAATREIRRVKWFNQLADYTSHNNLDVIIIPTATYRFLRSIRYSRLSRTPIPIVPIMHGINPREKPNFLNQITALKHFREIKPVVITLNEQVFSNFDTIHCLLPPYYPPETGINTASDNKVIKLGFFGQYRREKNLDAFLDVFLQCSFTNPVEILIQGATSLPEDEADFLRIQEKYGGDSRITFLHKSLIGQEWQKAIAAVDMLIMPYSAERYRYHWSAMLFTAIGFCKPVIVADTINPEVLAHYNIGMAFNPQAKDALQQVLEQFVNTYPEQKAHYIAELEKACTAYAPSNFVRGLLTLKG